MASSYTLVSFTDTSFTARAQASQTNKIRFDVRKTVTKTVENRFDIRHRAVNPASFTSTSFDTDSFVSVDQIPTKTFKFDIRAGNINSHIISNFDIRKQVSETSTNRFDIRKIVSDVLQVRIGLANKVSNVLKSLFDIRQVTDNTSTNRFDIRKSVGKLGSYVSDSFTTTSFTIADLSKTFKFDIREAIPETLEVRFDIISRVFETLTNRFIIRQKIPETTC